MKFKNINFILICFLIERDAFVVFEQRIQVQVTNKILLDLAIRKKKKLPVEKTEFPKVVKHTRALFKKKATRTEVNEQGKPEQDWN